MELTKFEIRVLLKHYWKQDHKAAATAREICEEEGTDVISEHVAQQLFQHFNAGEEYIEDLPHFGRSKLWDIKNICRVQEENPQKKKYS